MSSWILGRYGLLLPWIALLLVLTGTLFVDNHWQSELSADRAAIEDDAQEHAGDIADAYGNALSERLGALAAPRMGFTPMEDSVSARTFAAAVDSVTVQLTGLAAISALSPAGLVRAGRDAVLGRAGLDPRTDTIVRNAFLRASTTRAAAATPLIQAYAVRRIIVFDPVVRGDSVVGVLAAEIDPLSVYRGAVSALPSVPDFHGLAGPGGAMITTTGVPAGWNTVSRPVRLADTELQVTVGFLPPSGALYAGQRIATWVTGLAVGIALAAVLGILRRTVGAQREEIRRRQDAERQAREAAHEARELSAQLEAAHGAAQKLSTSLDPDYVLEFFLGVVAETLDADTGSLFTFDEEGELLVGRKRIVLRATSPETRRLKNEDIREVRVPVALLPQIARAATTGEAQVVHDAGAGEDEKGLPVGIETAAAWVTIPLQVGGHMNGVAVWEVFEGPRAFDPKDVAFAQALAAQAAATLRTAELYASLEAVSGHATQEAARFGAVLDQMADGVVIVDADGKVERFNAAAEDVLGDRPASASVWEWVAGLELGALDGRGFERADLPILRALRGDRVQRVSFLVRGETGEDRYLSASAAPIVAGGDAPSGAAMVVRDVTDEQQYAGMLRHTNQELRKQAALLEEINHRLREATAAKDRFLAVMSHELRTPLNAVIGYADLLELEIKGPINPDQRQMVRRVIETARHLLALIDEVLDLAKVGSGQVDLKIEPVPVGDVLDRALAQIAPLASAKGIVLEHLEAGEAGAIVALADRTRLTQVVLNLLSNAVKFTDLGRITLCARRDGDERVEVRVTDTGRGIPEDLHERIFEEFYQVEDGLTRSAGGSGLGLAIARRYARLMGGDLTVASRQGSGAEFMVVLPSAQAIGAEAGAAPAEGRSERQA